MAEPPLNFGGEGGTWAALGAAAAGALACSQWLLNYLRAARREDKRDGHQNDLYSHLHQTITDMRAERDKVTERADRMAHERNEAREAKALAEAAAEVAKARAAELEKQVAGLEADKASLAGEVESLSQELAAAALGGERR